MFITSHNHNLMVATTEKACAANSTFTLEKFVVRESGCGLVGRGVILSPSLALSVKANGLW